MALGSGSSLVQLAVAWTLSTIAPRRPDRSSARHHEWTTDKRGNRPVFHRRGPARPLRLHRSGAAAARPRPLHRPVMMSGQPTERGNGRFFTVAAGFARSVSIAAGRGAAALAAASARHDEWTISRPGNDWFSPSGPARSASTHTLASEFGPRPHPLPQGDLCESRFGAASRQLVALGPGFAACARESSGWSWRSLSQPRFPGRLQRTRT